MLAEDASSTARGLYAADVSVMVWWGTLVECASAVARRERAAQVDADTAERAYAVLESLRADWHEVRPSAPVRIAALRLLRVHDLRAADALQLAAALAASELHSESLPFVSFDARLQRAARREGFVVAGAP